VEWRNKTMGGRVMEQEIWKDVIGYEGFYQVSNLGRVRMTKDKRIKVPHENIYGYLVVKMTKNGIVKHHTIHRLVAMAFIENKENKPCVDHIDTNKYNNNVSNLRWVTPKENVNNPLSKKHKSIAATGRKYSEYTHLKWSMQRRGIGNSMFGKNHTVSAKMKLSKPVLQIDKDGNVVGEYYGITEASKKTGIHRQNISDVLNGRRKHARDYFWKYKD